MKTKNLFLLLFISVIGCMGTLSSCAKEGDLFNQTGNLNGDGSPSGNNGEVPGISSKRHHHQMGRSLYQRRETVCRDECPTDYPERNRLSEQLVARLGHLYLHQDGQKHRPAEFLGSPDAVEQCTHIPIHDNAHLYQR